MSSEKYSDNDYDVSKNLHNVRRKHRTKSSIHKSSITNDNSRFLSDGKNVGMEFNIHEELLEEGTGSSTNPMVEHRWFEQKIDNLRNEITNNISNSIRNINETFNSQIGSVENQIQEIDNKVKEAKSSIHKFKELYWTIFAVIVTILLFIIDGKSKTETEIKNDINNIENRIIKLEIQSQDNENDLKFDNVKEETKLKF